MGFLPLLGALLAVLVSPSQGSSDPAGEARARRARMAELYRRTEFLERVVFAAAEALDPAALQGHLFTVLRAGENPSALHVALRVMPEELARLHAAGLWKPSPALRSALLAAIEAEGLEKHTLKLLQGFAAEGEEHALLAARLLWRAGGERSWDWFEGTLGGLEPAARAPWIEACGARGEKALGPELARYLERPEASSLARVGTVALARLGHGPARAALAEILAEPAGETRDATLEALGLVAHAPELRTLVEGALRRTDLAPAQRLALQAGLVRGGSTAERDAVRAALSSARGGERLALVRALARAAQPADVEAFAALFPVSGDEEALATNALLAETLLVQRHPAANSLLRAALWGEGWSLGVLAGGLLARAGGLRALLDELEVAPPGASESDWRRVGFAIGEWGGLGAVEELARTRSEVDPALQGALLGALAARAAEAVPSGVRIERPAQPKEAPPRRKPPGP